jgi:hypothetical protein
MSALTGVVALALAAGASNADLDRAEKLFSAYQYEPALAALNRAKEVEGNDRSTLLRIFELQGVISGQLRRSAAAENAFRQLLTLDPEHRLSSDYAPRVMTPFFEAKRQVTESGPLVFKAIPAQVEPGTVRSVRARVDADPFHWARQVRFHLRSGETWSSSEVALSADGEASVETSGQEVAWWAELIGDRAAVLGQIADESNPQIDAAPPPSLSAGALTPPPPSTTAARASSSTPGSQWLSYGLIAGAAVSTGAGSYFGWKSQNDLSQINNAPRSGGVVQMTEVRANQLNDDSKRSAQIADGLFVAASALAVGGGLLFFLGPQTAVAPGPGSLSVVGSLP